MLRIQTYQPEAPIRACGCNWGPQLTTPCQQEPSTSPDSCWEHIQAAVSDSAWGLAISLINTGRPEISFHHTERTATYSQHELGRREQSCSWWLQPLRERRRALSTQPQPEVAAPVLSHPRCPRGRAGQDRTAQGSSSAERPAPRFLPDRALGKEKAAQQATEPQTEVSANKADLDDSSPNRWI